MRDSARRAIMYLAALTAQPPFRRANFVANAVFPTDKKPLSTDSHRAAQYNAKKGIYEKSR